MLTWNIGNTTVRNPQRLMPALQLFVNKMSGRPFTRREQQEFLDELVQDGLVDSKRSGENATAGDDGGRKFASAFKQLGFVTDWSRGQTWNVTPVGKLLIEQPQLEETIFLRQLLKYQLPSPLESGKQVQGFYIHPFRLLLRFLLRAREEQLIGLTKFEIALFVINQLDERNNEAFETAIADIKQFRDQYTTLVGKVKKSTFAHQKLVESAATLNLEAQSLLDYADSNARYALMSGLLTIHGNKLALSEARLPITEYILVNAPEHLHHTAYLDVFYNPDLPVLPTDNEQFLRNEIELLKNQLVLLANQLDETIVFPASPLGITISDLQGYEKRLRERLQYLREIQFYRNQKSPDALEEIEDLLEDISTNSKMFFGGLAYAPAFFEWAIWRLFLAINEILDPVNKTRGFQIDEDMNPIHHAKGGAADINFTYKDFRLVCEMTLATGSRQFAMEGEPVTRHVFKIISDTKNEKPVYGLFIAKKLDPNTVDAFYKARYWRDWTISVATPIVALEIEHVIALIHCMKSHHVTIADIRSLFDALLKLQATYENGPDWYKAYIKVYQDWLKTRHT